MASEEIKSPSRYVSGGPMECIETIFGSGHGEGFCIGSVMKYLRRYKEKNGAHDLEKAKQYIDFLIAYYVGGMVGLKSLLEDLEEEEMRFDIESMSCLGGVAESLPLHTGGRDTPNTCSSAGFLNKTPLVPASGDTLPDAYERRIARKEGVTKELLEDPNWPYNCTGVGGRKPEGGI